MHELSIIQSVVETVTEWLAKQPVRRITAVHMRVGVLSGVVDDALLFGYEVATAGTPLEGSSLVVHTVPIILHCPRCNTLEEIAGASHFCCPHCGTPTADVRQGREIEIESVEVEDEE